MIVTYRGPNGVGGAVDKFSYDGQLMKRFGGGSNGASGRFQSPWGAAVISMESAANIAGFGPYAPDVLIGNYRSGEIDAYNFTSGKYDGTLGTYASGVRSSFRSFSPVSGRSISAPACRFTGRIRRKRNSPCSSPKIQSLGILTRSTARSRLSSCPSDPLMSRTGFVDPSEIEIGPGRPGGLLPQGSHRSGRARRRRIRLVTLQVRDDAEARRRSQRTRNSFRENFFSQEARVFC